MKEKTYDVVVIGAGPGGYVSAIRSSQLGLKTAIVEKKYMGGVCLNVGCVPSKALITASEFFYKLAHDAKAMGISINGSASVDMNKLQKWKESICKKMSSGISSLLKGNKVDIVNGEASFISPEKLEVKLQNDDVQYIRSKYFVLAMGSSPIELPQFTFDEKNILSSTGGLNFQEVPKRITVIGGGYIGLEIAGYLCHLGSKVTVLEASSEFLGGLADKDITEVIIKHFKKIGVTLLTNCKAQSWKSKGEDLIVNVDIQGQKQDILTDKILIAVGRRPNSDQANIKGIGLEFDKGFVKVDKQRRTNIPHIFAIGDIAGQPMLAHKASYEGILVAEVLAGKKRIFDAKVIPSVVFTHPEFASVGLSERECQEQGLSVKISRFPFAANARAFCFQEVSGFVKMIADSRNDLILGVHIVGPQASQLISEAALAIEMGATLEDMACTIHPHPTLSETLMESCEAALGYPIHILR